jgi:hypothetical protein
MVIVAVAVRLGFPNFVHVDFIVYVTTVAAVAGVPEITPVVVLSANVPLDRAGVIEITGFDQPNEPVTPPKVAGVIVAAVPAVSV